MANDSNHENTDGLSQEQILQIRMLEFYSLFPTEADCIDAVFNCLNENDQIFCKNCQGTVMIRQSGSRIAKCIGCNEKTWYMANTFFHGVKRFSQWLLAIWLMDRKVAFNANQLSRNSGIAYSTALKIFQTITLVLTDQMNDVTDQVFSSFFSPLICKRSRETPAGEHPRAEQVKLEQVHEAHENNGGPTNEDHVLNIYEKAIAKIEDTNYNVVRTKQIFQIIWEFEKEVHFDYLCAQSNLQPGLLSAVLTMLELDRLIVRSTGDWYQRIIPERTIYSISESSQVMVDSIVKFVRKTFHGISRKYLQNYIAAYWCQHDCERWKENDLFKACSSFRRVRYEELLDYVSPLMVKVSLGPNAIQTNS